MTSRRALGWAVLILLLATGLRAWNLGQQSLWFDEGIAWHAATRPTLGAALVDDPTNPPLYFGLLFGWVRLLGDSEVAMRTLPLFEGMLLVALIGAAARRWFGRRAGTLALILAALNPLLWWASQEIRMYSQMGLLGLWLALGLVEIATKPKPPRWAWIAVIAAELGTLYTHNTGIVVLGAVNLVFAAAWIGSAARRRPDWRRAGLWAIAQIGIVLAWSPELVSRFINVSTDNAATLKPPTLTLDLIWQSWQGLWAASWEMVRANPAALQWIAVGLLPLAALALLAARRTAGRLVLGLLAAGYATLLAALAVIGVDLHSRYLVLFAPLALIAIAGGLSNLSKHYRLSTLVQTLAVIGVAAAWIVLPGQANPAYQHDQAREMAAYYAGELQPGDLVLAWTYAERYDLMYYWDRLGVAAERVELPEGADAEHVLSLINTHLAEGQSVRVERNIWYMQGADARGMLPCLLGNGTTGSLFQWTVNGMASEGIILHGTLAHPPRRAAVPYDFGMVTLRQTGLPESALPANTRICIPFEAQMNAAGTMPLRASLKILNRLGMEIASSDAPLMTAAQIDTARLAEGEAAQAYVLIELPQGTPPGDYPIQLRVYSAAQPSGLDVLDPVSRTPAGKNAALGDLHLVAGDWPPFAAGCAIEMSPGITLADCSRLPGGPLAPGQTLLLTLPWQIETLPQPITVSLAGSDWTLANTDTPATRGAVLDWRTFTLPASAAGALTLSAQAGDNPPVILGEFAIDTLAVLSTPPAVNHLAEIEFPGVGTLYGFDAPDRLTSGLAPIDIGLVWRPSQATENSLAVTVQLLDGQGKLLAQHDGAPAYGSRPTTGWQPGEYVIDIHPIVFREEAVGYVGQARLIVALYDPLTGQRVLTASGLDYSSLLEGILVERG